MRMRVKILQTTLKTRSKMIKRRQKGINHHSKNTSFFNLDASAAESRVLKSIIFLRWTSWGPSSASESRPPPPWRSSALTRLGRSSWWRWWEIVRSKTPGIVTLEWWDRNTDTEPRQVHEAYQYLVTKKKKMSGRTMTENWDLTRRKSMGVALLSMATAAAKEVNNGFSAGFTFIF